MATWKLRLAEPPAGVQARELWMQHAAGLILMEDARGYAVGQLPASLSPPERVAAMTAIDDVMYGLMAVIDGVTGALKGEPWAVSLGFTVRLHRNGEVQHELDLFDGDGMSMGVHRWLAGDFGEDPVIVA